MSNIFNFTPKDKLDAKSNLLDFIEKCRNDLTVFGDDLDWENWHWKNAGQFVKAGVNSRAAKEKDSLHEDFLDFAKAYFRYQQGQKPTKTRNELKALKAIEAALVEVTGGAKISDLSFVVLDEAAICVRKSYAGGSAYQGGRELERLATFVSRKHLIPIDIESWKSPIPRKRDLIQTGAKAKKRREKKLPSEEVLQAMAEIFANNSQEPKDIFTSSVFALTMCAPSRISEILELPVDCEFETTDRDNNPCYGFRYFGGKGFGAHIKWVPTEMVSVAKEAIKRIKRLTEPARELARHIEKHPNKFYRHSFCPDVADDKLLTIKQAAEALEGVRNSKEDMNNTLSNAKLAYRDGVHTLDSLSEHIKKRQPKDFPWLIEKRGIKYSDALFCMTKNQLHDIRTTSPIILWCPTNNIFNNDISTRESLDSNHKSIFDRYGFKDKSGNRLKLTSHQARHFLNTMAQGSELRQKAIADWSSRADISQNRVYNHMTEYEMVAKAEELDTSMELYGPAGEVAKHIPVTVQEFNTLEKATPHITEFGFCVHDYTMSPCDKFRDCLNCSEQVCVKGMDSNLERIKFQFNEYEKRGVLAEQAMKEGTAGADRWYEYYENTLKHLKELISILENPEIEDGARVKLINDKAFSPLNRAIESKLSAPRKLPNDDEKMLEDMTALLGGGFG